jgi:hypothetical protein
MRALDMIDGELFIFSDDLKWCKEHFSGTFVDLPDYLAFDLMRQFKYHIIANSTFSQWAAHLSPHLDKVVIYPETPCVNKAIEHLKKNHYPKNWILC